MAKMSLTQIVISPVMMRSTACLESRNFDRPTEESQGDERNPTSHGNFHAMLPGGKRANVTVGLRKLEQRLKFTSQILLKEPSQSEFNSRDTSMVVYSDPCGLIAFVSPANMIVSSGRQLNPKNKGWCRENFGISLFRVLLEVEFLIGARD
jgi:hypothetical protein